MKLVIPTDGNSVSGHFGRCPLFTIVEVESNAVVFKEVIDNPGHSPGFLPKFFNDKGVGCIIAGGMGMSAQNLFNQYNIEQIIGIAGTIDEVVEQYINGSLVSGESACSPGGGKGYGIDKTVCDHGGHH
jgi:predicted Fe-Mo cluster-binding NifX family protein